MLYITERNINMNKMMCLILYSAGQVTEASFPKLLHICRHQTGTVSLLQKKRKVKHLTDIVQKFFYPSE
jgi:hypothetical protein